MKLTKEVVRELISYCPTTGVARWRPRDSKWFNDGKHTAEHKCNLWNSRYAGKDVSYIDFNGYIQVSLFNKKYKLHRLIWFYMTGEWPNQVDHINGIRHDNRWVNLRNVDNKENSRNSSKSTNNTSGFVGVGWHKSAHKWYARIKVNGKEIHLGLFISKEDAVRARKNAEIKYGFHKNHGRD